MKLGEQSSDEWEKIKHWVGSAKKDSKHPVRQELERIQNKKPLHMDMGGQVPPQDDIMRLLEPQGAGLIAPSAFGSPTTPPPVISNAPPPVQRPMIPDQNQSPNPMAPQPAPSEPLPDDGSYDRAAGDVLGGTGGDLRRELSAIQKPSWQETLGRVGASVSDAIARGPGGQQDSGYLKEFDDRMASQRAALSQIPGQVAGRGKEQFALSQQLQASDPKSPFSRTTQRAYQADLIKAGIRAQDIQYIPASLAHDILAGRTDLAHVDAEVEKAKSEAALAGASLGLNTMKANADIEHQKTDEEMKNREFESKEEEDRLKAAEALSKRGPLDKFYGIIPGTTSNDLKNALQDKMAHSFKTEAQAEAAGLPDGTPVIINGVRGKWRHH